MHWLQSTRHEMGDGQPTTQGDAGGATQIFWSCVPWDHIWEGHELDRPAAEHSHTALEKSPRLRENGVRHKLGFGVHSQRSDHEKKSPIYTRDEEPGIYTCDRSTAGVQECRVRSHGQGL